MAGDVNIVIEAQDKASVVLEKVAKKTEENVKQIRESGEATKKSTELVGAFASALGDTGLGSYASQFAGLTEKASAFSETMKEGAGNSLAFKAGLAGLTGVIAFSVGNALGNVIFQTERWKEELALATVEAERLAAAVLETRDYRFSLEIEEAKLLKDPEAQRAQLQKLLDEVRGDIQANNQQLEGEITGSISRFFMAVGTLGQSNAMFDAADREREQAEKNLALLRDQEKTLSRQLSERQANLEKQREQNALEEKSSSYVEALREQVNLLKLKGDELNAHVAAQNTLAADQAEAASLLSQRDALQAEAERVKTLEKITEELTKQFEIETYGADEAKRREQLAVAANDEERKRLQNLQDLVDKQKEHNDLVKSANEDIKKQETELAKAREKQAKEQEDISGKLSAFTAGTTATESRLLTRGPQQKGIDKIADYTEQSAKTLERMENLLEQTKQNANTLELEFV